MLICAQSGRVSGLEKKTDPASKLRSKKKGLRDNKNRLLGIVNQFCIPFGTKSKIIICTVVNCTVVNHHRTANFRVKHHNPDIEQSWRGILLPALLFIQLILILLYRFSLKKTVSYILIPPQITIFEISIFSEISAKLVCYIAFVQV